MTISEQYIAMAEYVEKATGADREIDWAIADALGLVPPHSIREVGFDYDWYRHPDEFMLGKAIDAEGRNMEWWSAQKVTASLDAIVALIERELPGSSFKVGYQTDEHCESDEKPGWWSQLFLSWDSDAETPEDGFMAEGTPNGALALCAAFLRAKASLAGEDESHG